MVTKTKRINYTPVAVGKVRKRLYQQHIATRSCRAGKVAIGTHVTAGYIKRNGSSGGCFNVQYIKLVYQSIVIGIGYIYVCLSKGQNFRCFYQVG